MREPILSVRYIRRLLPHILQNFSNASTKYIVSLNTYLSLDQKVQNSIFKPFPVFLKIGVCNVLSSRFMKLGGNQTIKHFYKEVTGMCHFTVMGILVLLV